jgi:beta-aspartyl-peptidase (threonine type)
MKLVLGKWATDRVAGGTPPELAAREAIGYLNSRVNGHGGMILLDSQGRYGVAHNTPRMAWAVKTSKSEDVGITI